MMRRFEGFEGSEGAGAGAVVGGLLVTMLVVAVVGETVWCGTTERALGLVAETGEWTLVAWADEAGGATLKAPSAEPGD